MRAHEARAGGLGRALRDSRCGWRRGYTLFELTVVVMIIGIAAGAVLVAINSGGIYSSRLKLAANTVAADIEYAEGECINQPSTPRGVLFDVTHNKYSVLDSSTNAVIAHPADGQPYVNDFSTGRNAELSGVTITGVEQGTTALSWLTFNVYGRPLLTADATVTLTYQGQTMTVVVDHVTGDVSIQ